MCDKPLAQGQAQCKHLTTVVAFLERRADKWLRKAKERKEKAPKLERKK